MSFYNDLINASWVVWFIIIAVIIFILWIFVGGGNYEYVGLAPLKIGVDSTKYVDDQVYGVIERSNYHAEKVSGIDITPRLPQSIESDAPVSNNDDQVNNNHENNNQGNNREKRNIFIPSGTTDQPIGPLAPTDPIPLNKKKCSKGEKICREIIEEIYGKPFPSCRPHFLKNPETKRNLELDCYNDELKIAVEYNGIQHYKWPNFTNQSQEDFVKQIRRDKFKVEMCDVNGVYLITVPYNVPHDQIKQYINYYRPENYHQRTNSEKNPNQIYLDLVDYNDNYDFDGESESDMSETDDDSDIDTENSDELTQELLCSAMFSEEDDDIMQSYEISFVTKNH